uniref:Restorer of fertility-like protein n=1 Tax=Triticum aestivum TaxID=4565 RepID=A0A7S5S128_WHEAT|nr:restorer of fertility-like protein [Triticum aestivum]QIP66411.1 restorer of fertility-like protein [Triticum aestivum]
MPRLSSTTTTPMSPLRLRLRLRARHSASTSHSSRSWEPHAAFAAAAERARSGNLTPEDAHDLFDELLRQGNPVQERPLNKLLSALARAPASAACRNGPALAVNLFSRISQGARLRVAQPTACTYGVLMDCCCRAHRLDLTLAFFGGLLRTGLEADQVIFCTLLKGLCHAKCTDEALNVLLHRMPELGCTPNVVAYNTVIHGFFREGQVGKACNLFHEMRQQGVTPDVVTYNSVIDVLCMLVDLGSDRVKSNVKGMSQEPTFVAFDPNRIALIGGTSNRQMVLVPYCQRI